ncbi:MAG: UvrD-helicase domain-containing protein [Defluviitaleaceae bacterium]|nr:UvrD-helicase domain-containing protein [Defluviitaleaceae bacterium]
MSSVEEKEKLSKVMSLILTQINEMARTLQDRRKDLRDAHKEVWAETPIIRNMDDVLNLTMLSSEIAQHERQYAQTNIKLGQLKNMMGSPYFARIDFIEEGYADTEEIYIGKYSLFDNNTFLVYDWRAPISSMYYDYGVGKASFVVPEQATIFGEITLKRQYHIVNGELVYLFDSELAIDDEILQLELSRASDAKIKTIIHTIQREQNKAIRSEAEHLLVFGPAGSGKTSVGLHRLAFLLYKHRGSLTSAKVRIFSPGSIFASYIDGIIPELGEEDVLTLDFPTLLKQYGRNNVFYDSYEHYDFLQTSNDSDPRRLWLAQKYSSEFVSFLEEYIRTYKPYLDEDIYFNKDLLCPKERIKDLYLDRTSAGNLSSKTSRVLQYVSRTHDEYFADNKKAITDFFNSLQDENLSDNAIRRRFDEQKNIVIMDLRNRLMPKSKRLYKKILQAWYKKLKRDNKPGRLPDVNEAVNTLKWDKLLFEDALSLFYIDILTGRVSKDKQVKHILIDEAQDISYLQHRILRALHGNDCHFTVLADVNQALYSEIHLHEESDIQNLYPSASTMPLTTSYRSTYEISKFATDVLGLSHSGAYQRRGESPQIMDTKNPAASAVEIIEKLPEHFNTIGILLTSDREAKEFYSQFKQLYEGSRSVIADVKDSFEPGIMIMAVPLAKGLEFDAVICPEYGSDAFESYLGRKFLYLICTRALHRLYLLRCLAE